MTDNCTVNDAQQHRFAPLWATQVRDVIGALCSSIAWARTAQRLVKAPDRNLTGQTAPRDQLAQRVLTLTAAR